MKYRMPPTLSKRLSGFVRFRKKAINCLAMQVDAKTASHDDAPLDAEFKGADQPDTVNAARPSLGGVYR
jgi:hypothetical protein